MTFKYVQKIPNADQILDEIPLSSDLKKIKEQRDTSIADIFRRKLDKFILIIGPCSADNEKAVCQYASRLSQLQEKVQEKLILIPRVYTNKPRTTGIGYKGMLHQPDPAEKPNLVEGIKAIRKMHVRILKETGLTSADEMLYPQNYPYLEDILSYVAIGARSVENQQHRLTISGLDVPVGMKNPTSGDLTVMLNSIIAGQQPHVFNYHDWEVKTSGNPLAHGMLRGAMNQHGQMIPNYHYEDLIRLAEMYMHSGFQNPTIIVDASHANSNKNFQEQPRIAKEIIHSRRSNDLIKDMVKGIMIESYLLEGAQDVQQKEFGKSITDPCLGWEDTEKLILHLADYV